MVRTHTHTHTRVQAHTTGQNKTVVPVYIRWFIIQYVSGLMDFNSKHDTYDGQSSIISILRCSCCLLLCWLGFAFSRFWTLLKPLSLCVETQTAMSSTWLLNSMESVPCAIASLFQLKCEEKYGICALTVCVYAGIFNADHVWYTKEQYCGLFGYCIPFIHTLFDTWTFQFGVLAARQQHRLTKAW